MNEALEPKITTVERKMPLAVTLVGPLIAVVVGLSALISHNQSAASRQAYSQILPQVQLPTLPLLWKHESASYEEGTPIIANNTLYMIVSDVYTKSDRCVHEGFCYQLHALDMATGKLRWLLDDYQYPPTVANGIVYSGWGGELHAIDASTHQVIWRFKSESARTYAPSVTNDIKFAPAVANGIMYFGSGDKLYAVYADTGIEKWHVKYTDEIASSPVVAGDIIYMIGSYIKMAGDVLYSQNNLYAVRRENGQQLWEFDPTYDNWPSGVVGNFAVGDFVVADDGAVFCTSVYSGPDGPDILGHIYAFEGESGQQFWERSSGGGPLVVQGGLLYVRDTNDTIYAIDTKTGEVRWEFTASKLSSGAGGPALAKGTLYTTSADGIVFGVDAQSGKVTSSYRVGKDYYLDAPITDGNIYFMGRNQPDLRDLYLLGLPAVPVHETSSK